MLIKTVHLNEQLVQRLLTLVVPAEVAAPTASAFYVRWNESENSEFNQIAARIVARRVVSDYPKLGHLGFVQQMATTHLKYLRARYRRQTNPAYIAKEPERLRSSSAATRKRTVSVLSFHSLLDLISF